MNAAEGLFLAHLDVGVCSALRLFLSFTMFVPTRMTPSGKFEGAPPEARYFRNSDKSSTCALTINFEPSIPHSFANFWLSPSSTSTHLYAVLFLLWFPLLWSCL